MYIPMVMARTISISDDVYEWLKRKKGDKSFSELIRDELIKETDLKELEGIGFSKDWKDAEKEIKEASEKNWKSIEETFK